MAYDATIPADAEFIANGPADIRQNQTAIVNDAIVNAGTVNGLSTGNLSGNIPVSNGTLNTNLNASMLGGLFSSAFALASHIHANATESSNGFMSSTDKTKLDGISVGAQVNQDAFSNIIVGSETLQASQAVDTFSVLAGTNIALTPSATNKNFTIGVTGVVASAATAAACTGNAATSTTFNSNSPAVKGNAVGINSIEILQFEDSANTRQGYIGKGSSLNYTIFLENDLGDVELLSIVADAVISTPNGNAYLDTAKTRIIASKLDLAAYLPLGGGILTGLITDSNSFKYGSIDNLFSGIQNPSGASKNLILSGPQATVFTSNCYWNGSNYIFTNSESAASKIVLYNGQLLMDSSANTPSAGIAIVWNSGSSGYIIANISSTVANASALSGYTYAQVLANAISGAGSGIVASSLGTNGYIKFSNGYAKQWGKIIGLTSTANGNLVTATFPLQFTTIINARGNVFGIQNSDTVINTYSESLASAVFSLDDTYGGSTSGISLEWEAFGTF
jgi:hypothetical protein